MTTIDTTADDQAEMFTAPAPAPPAPAPPAPPAPAPPAPAGIVQDRWKTSILTEIQQKAADLQQLLDGLGRKPLRSP